MTSTRPLATALNIAARDFGSLLNASKAGQVSLGRSQRQQPHYLRGHDQGPLGEPVLGRSNDRQLDPNDGWALQKHWGGIPPRPWDGGEGKLSRSSGAFILVHCRTRVSLLIRCWAQWWIQRSSVWATNYLYPKSRFSCPHALLGNSSKTPVTETVC